jgi:hypothetical protein
MEQHPESPRSEGAALTESPQPLVRNSWFDGHMPDVVDPLDPRHPETAFTETRRLRHDGWTPDKKRLFLERVAECGIVSEACRAAGMSARAAYNLRDRDPLFAAGWEAASAMARPRLADEAFSRAMNGMVDRIYKDGAIVAERHRYDNRLTMSVLARLDARVDRAEERGDPHLRLVGRWDEYLDALAEDRREDGMALMAEPESAPAESAEDRELHELHLVKDTGANDWQARDDHYVWEDKQRWWTDYPPPPGFEGEQEGEYGCHGYRRALTAEEQTVIDADEEEDKAERRARGEAQRRAYFFGIWEEVDEEPGAPAPNGAVRQGPPG